MRSDRGQVLVLLVVSLVVLIGMAAFVIDVGSWWRADRQAQSRVDAAALAGAQAAFANGALDQDEARALANQYAADNGAVGTLAITFPEPNTIAVELKEPAPGFFAKIFAIDSVNVHARAVARTGYVSGLANVSPFTVWDEHDAFVSCGAGNVCKNKNYDLPYDRDAVGNIPGAFGLLNLNQGSTGNVGTSTLEEWILTGYDGYLPAGPGEYYYSDPGAKFNSSQIKSALDWRIANNPVLLIPIWTSITGQGQNAQYEIIGWAAFHLTSYTIQGNDAVLHGYFENVIWNGIQGAPGTPNFGVRDVDLIE